MSIADAYVELHVDGDNLATEFKTSIRKATPDAEKESDKSGASLGSRLAAGFFRGFDKSWKSKVGNLSKRFESAFSGLNPKRLFLPALAASLPVLTSAASALTGALTALTGAIIQAGGESLAFIGILGSLIQAKIVATIAFKDFTKAVGGDTEAMKALSPAAQDAAKAAKSLTKEWTGVKHAIQEEVFQGLDTVIARIGEKTLPMLKTQLAGTGTVLNGVLKRVGGFVTSKRFVDQFGKALEGNNKILKVLGKAAVPVLRGILSIFRALQPSAQRLSIVIVGVAKHFSQWANSAGRAKGIDDFMRKAFRNAKNLFGIFKNLGSVLKNVFSAAAPAGGNLLKTLEHLTGKLADFTALASSKNAIAEWARNGIKVSGQLFHIIGQVWKIIQPLFNTAIAGSVFSIFEKAMPSIVNIINVVKSALLPIFKSIGDTLAENGPKFAALFSALAPLLKGVGAVLGQIITQAIGSLGTIAAVITPVVKIISGVLGPVLTKLAPVIAFLILAFTNWGSAIIKVIPIVGKFISPLVKLYEVVFGGIVKGIQLVTNALKPFALIWANVFTSIVGLFNIVVNAAKAFWNILFGHSIFPDIMKGLKVFQQVFGVIFHAIGAIVHLAIAPFKLWWAAIKLAVRLVGSALRGAVGIVKSVFSSIGNAVKTGIGNVVDFFVEMPGKILDLAGEFLKAGLSLGKHVIQGLWDGLKAVGGFVGDLAGSIKDAINSVLHLPFTIHGPGPLPDFTIPAFAMGTEFAPGGLALVGERGPEIVNLPRGSRVNTNQDSRRMFAQTGSTLPKKVILRIGAKDFVAYVSEVADDRIAADNSLAWQGT